MNEISNKTYLKFLKKSGINFFLQNEPNNFYKVNSSKKSLQIQNKIENISNIEELKIFIKNYNDCKLKKNTKSSVIGKGNKSAKILIIGDTPNAEEEEIGEPFVGKAGELFKKMINAINLDLNKVYTVNIIPWRTPNDREPSNKEILECLPIIQKYIELINPQFILLLGSVATKIILTSNKDFLILRGKWYKYKNLHLKSAINCLATFNPAFLLLNQNCKREAWNDLKMFQTKIEND